MYCHNCGTQVKDGAKYCTVCGASLTDENAVDQVKRVQVKVKQSQTPAQKVYVVQERPKRKSHWFLWLLILILIVAVAFLYFSPFTRGLFVYSDFDFRCSLPLSAEEENEIISLNRDAYNDNYLWRYNNGYELINLETGVSTNERQLEAEGDGMIDVKIETLGSYAYVKNTIGLFDNAVTLDFTYYFRRASLFERAYFVYKMISLMTV